jgi:hypothetical protein
MLKRKILEYSYEKYSNITASTTPIKNNSKAILKNTLNIV